MTLPTRFLPEFFPDANGAAQKYEQEKSGLGKQFHEQLHGMIERIVAMPESFPLVDRVTRVAMIRPFAYGVYFRIEPAELVFTAVLHLHRKPGVWRQ